MPEKEQSKDQKKQSQNLKENKKTKTSATPPDDFNQPSFIIHPLFLILAVLIFTALIGFFYLRGLVKQKPKPLTISKNQTAQPAISPISKFGLTTNWQTFQSGFGYSLQYPAEGQLYLKTAHPTQEKNFFEEDDEAVIQFKDSQTNQLIFLLRLKKPFSNPEKLSLNQWLKRRYPVLSLVKTTKITLNQNSAVKVNYWWQNKISEIFIPGDKQIYRILAEIKDKKKYDYNSIFEQILSTLQFPEAKPSSSPTEVLLPDQKR